MKTVGCIVFSREQLFSRKIQKEKKKDGGRSAGGDRGSVLLMFDRSNQLI